MTTKTSKARHERFLAAGLFPPEMPSCFYSSTFGPSRDKLIAAFSALPPTKDKKPAHYFYLSERANFTYPRYNREDRHHAYLNPISFFFLSRVLADNYVKLRAISRKSKLSISPSVFDWAGRRALVGPVFGPRNVQEASLNARFEFIATADIQGFYHSIYTHAIAWAIHGKAVAKKSRRNYGLYGNLIDLFVRNGQDGQSIGIPVGPDTSRLIAEVVGAALDQAIQKSLHIGSSRGGPAKRRGMRFVDDYTFGCTTLQEAEKFIAAVRRAANGFELELNNSKTGPRLSSPTVSLGWREHLRSLLPSSPADADQLQRYFYNAEIVARDNPASDVRKFALMSATRTLLDTNEWAVVQDYLLSVYRRSGTVIQQMVELIMLRQTEKGDVNTDVLADFVNARIPTLADLLKGGEIVWLLFLAICLKLPLRTRTIARLVELDDGAIALLMSDARRAGIVPPHTIFSRWESTLSMDSLNGPMWLYAYESARLSLNGTVGDGYVKSHPYFQHLLTNGVAFYRSGPAHFSSHEVLRSRRAEAMRRRLLEAKIEEDLAEEFWELEEEDAADDDDVYA